MGSMVLLRLALYYFSDVVFYTRLDVVLLNVVFLEDGYSKVVVYYVLYNTKKQQCIFMQARMYILNMYTHKYIYILRESLTENYN